MSVTIVSHIDVEFITKKFYEDRDDDKAAFIKNCLGLKDSQFFLLQGPPGTGKTTAIIELIFQLIRSGKRILVTSHTNIAVDNILEELLKATNKNGERLLNGNLTSNISKIGSVCKTSTSARLFLIPNTNNSISKMDRINAALNKPVVGATLSQLGFLTPHIEDWRTPVFDYVIIDEASMASIPLSFLGILAGKRYIVVGDHKQLRPIFKTKFESPCKLSLFEVLVKNASHRKIMLRTQYRFNSQICSLVNDFYDGQLKPNPLVSNRRFDEKIKFDTNGVDPSVYGIIDPKQPIVWVDTSAEDTERENYWYKTGGGDFGEKWTEYKSCYNYGNAALCIMIAQKLIRCGVPPDAIVVLTPFKRQTKLIKRACRKFIPQLKTTNIIDFAAINSRNASTVYAYQGKEAEIVIFDFVCAPLDVDHPKHNPRSLEDARIINVAISRAKSKIILVGSSALAESTIGRYKIIKRLYDGHILNDRDKRRIKSRDINSSNYVEILNWIKQNQNISHRKLMK